MLRDIRYRVLLSLASLVLLLFCLWTGALLVNIRADQGALALRVRALDATQMIQGLVARSPAAEIPAEEPSWAGGAEALHATARRLLPGGCGPGTARALQLALPLVRQPEPPVDAQGRLRLIQALLDLSEALRAEQDTISQQIERRIDRLFLVAIGAIVLAVSNLVSSWWVLSSRERLSRLGERLSRQAQVDYLTGVWNRRMVLELLDRELLRSARGGLPVAVIMFDLDHFKRINDSLGHTAGDRALIAVSAQVSRLLRGYDLLGRMATAEGQDGEGDELLGRYGGEEFLVVLPGHDLAEGRLVAERLRGEIEALPTLREEGRVITASFGVAASIAGAQVPAAALIQAADEALYRAKERGRNRVELCPEPLEGPIWS
jgi:GGDEF domain-containing protein